MAGCSRYFDNFAGYRHQYLKYCEDTESANLIPHSFEEWIRIAIHFEADQFCNSIIKESKEWDIEVGKVLTP